MSESSQSKEKQSQSDGAEGDNKATIAQASIMHVCDILLASLFIDADVVLM